MYGKKIAVFFILLIICSFAGCDTNNPPAVNDVQGNQADWLLKQLGFANDGVEQIQVTTDGKVLVSSAGRIYQSRGEEFEDIGPPEPVSIFYVLERENAQTLIAGSNSGVLYMKDIRDKDWQKTNLKACAQPLNTIAGDIGNGYIYVGQASKLGGGLWRSRDGGKNWEKMTGDTARCVVVHPENSQVLYAVDRATRLSADQGKTWTKIDTAANYGVLIHPLSPEIGYIAFSQGVVVAEHDGKVTETRRFELLGSLTCLEMNFAVLGEWAVGIWDYPSGVGGLYFSLDSGSSWMKIEDRLINTRITDMRFDKAGNRLYIGTAEKGLWVLNVEKIRK